ncbi:MAG: V-type ATP synthase subunit D [candidate division WOR-3 bacterium]|nr:V-type ATP synthase subunit D [candidate division WOR-3 bacterium]MCX7947436.1 V-type ATP synthase subunit D [candidate division WOR-3 bacterium]MDW8150596.1 V-type ATP synthase subunit D [candidate division WOR-3 bacterium]
MQQISPTRMNLLNLRRQIQMAIQGANLLKNKRDALMNEFRKLITIIVRERKALDEELRKSINMLTIAMSIDGKESLESVALSSGKKLEIEMIPRKAWGVKVTEFRYGDIVKSAINRGFSPVSITSRVQLTAQSFEKSIDAILRVVPLEYKLRKFGEEIRKTNRRVNALEQKLIPEMREQSKFIRQVLEDREREDKFRLKILKKKAEKKKSQ